MSSSIRRRSGNAVATFCDEMKWEPDWVFQVGIGQAHDEVDVFREHWPDVQFAGCEPSPSILKQLGGTYPGLVLPYAVDFKEGHVDLHTKSKHKDGNSLHEHLNKNPKNRYRTVEVECHTLDWILRFHGPFGSNMLLWLDCEGNEAQALFSGGQMLVSVNVVTVELSGNPLGEGWCRPLEVHALLRIAGFVQAWCHTNRIHARQYDAIYVRREMLKPELCMCLQELEP